MPTLGGITAWISVGDKRLDEYGVGIEDDVVKCYVEVPPSSTPLLETPNPLNAPLSTAAHGRPEYAINWKIQDLTYTLVAVASIDGAIDVEKIHLGKVSLSAPRSTDRIDSVPVTDDWSKRRMLNFTTLKAAEGALAPPESTGSIRLSFYRAGKAGLKAAFKSTATGFHTESPVDAKKLLATTSVDGLYQRSHSTGLGSIAFGPPKKVWGVAARDKYPYVTFEFAYRSRELIVEALPDEGLELSGAPPPEAEPMPLSPGVEPDEHEIEPSTAAADHGHEHEFKPTHAPSAYRKQSEDITFNGSIGGGSPPQRRPSLADRARGWASKAKQSAQGVRLTRTRTNDSVNNRVEVVSTSMDAIRNPFRPHGDLPRSPGEPGDVDQTDVTAIPGEYPVTDPEAYEDADDHDHEPDPAAAAAAASSDAAAAGTPPSHDFEAVPDTVNGGVIPYIRDEEFEVVPPVPDKPLRKTSGVRVPRGRSGYKSPE